MKSVQMQLQHQLCESSRSVLSRLVHKNIESILLLHDRELTIIAMVKVTGAFQKSSEIMKTTNQLVKLPQLSATMREMSMEMMKVSPCFKLV